MTKMIDATNAPKSDISAQKRDDGAGKDENLSHIVANDPNPKQREDDVNGATIVDEYDIVHGKLDPKKLDDKERKLYDVQMSILEFELKHQKGIELQTDHITVPGRMSITLCSLLETLAIIIALCASFIHFAVYSRNYLLAVLGGFHGDVVEVDIFAEEGMEIPAGGVPAQDSMETDILTLVQEHQLGTAQGTLLHILPPGGIDRVAVDDALANNGDIPAEMGAEEALAAGKGVALPGADLDGLPGSGVVNLTGKDGVVFLAGVAKQHGVLLKFQGHAGFEDKRPHVVGACRNGHSSVFGAGIDGGLDGCGVIGDSVACGAKIPDADAAAFRQGRKAKLFVAQGDTILRSGTQLKQGKNIGAHARQGGRTI